MTSKEEHVIGLSYIGMDRSHHMTLSRKKDIC